MKSESEARLGAYRLVSPLGHGGMGEVFLAWDERLKRHVALKRIRADRVDERYRARFRREARAVASLSHPSVVQIYDVLEIDGDDCIVMEYIEGQGLNEILADGPLEFGRALRLGRDIAEGLAAAHEKGLIHRDLKAANVRVPASPRTSAKVLDFGLVRTLSGDDAYDSGGTLTETGAIVGTPHSMSPEQIKGLTLDHRSDLFSLGVLLYQMLTGRSPFLGKSGLDSLRRVMTTEPEPIERLRPGIPPLVADLVTRLLAKDPGWRPPNARQVADEIAALMDAPWQPVTPSQDEPLANLPTLGGTESATTMASAINRSELEEATSGWRPAAGRKIPRRLHWILVERLALSEFGEVWLARHKTGDQRVFKFCFEDAKLHNLKRKVTFFRLLRESLGERVDIVHICDWSFESAPYFVEEEYTEGGDLPSWAERQGGLLAVPLETRLELVAQVAEALAAAHSVGILHKDVQPGNVLVRPGRGGRPRIRLTDFGIAGLTDERLLENQAFTIQGMTEATDLSARGPRIYVAPEILEGRLASIQADIYSLGVMLYQMVVGDFGRALAPGWRRDVDDEILAEDIACCVDGRVDRRPESAREVARQLRRLPERRTRRAAEREARRAAEQARRRRRAGGLTGILAALLLIVVSFFALYSARARHDAEERRQQADQLIDFMLGDLRAKLEPMGQLEILKDVGNQALDYFAAMPREKLSDRELLGYSKVLDQIGHDRFRLGEHDAAMAAFRESLWLAEDLAARDPSDTDRQFALAQSHFWVGYILAKQHALEGALEHFEAYREITGRRLSIDPDDPVWRLEAAYAQSNVAHVLNLRDDVEEALQALHDGAQILEGLLAEGPEDLRYAAELGTLYNRMGNILVKNGELERAHSAYERSLALRRQLVDRDPADTGHVRSLSATHNRLGILQRFRGKLERSLDHLRIDLALISELAGQDPDNVRWQQELAVTHLALANATREAVDLVAARRHVDTSSEILARLRRKDPSHDPWRRLAAKAYTIRCAVAGLAGATTTARSSADAALELYAALEGDLAGAAFYQEWAVALWWHGRVAADPTTARESWLAAVEILEPFATKSRDVVLLDYWVRNLFSLGRFDQARDALARLEASRYVNRELAAVVGTRTVKTSTPRGPGL